MRKIVYGFLAFNGLVFLASIAIIAFVLIAYHPQTMAQATAEQIAQPQTSTGKGIALLGAAMATAGSSLGAGVALSGVGAAAIGAVTEKPGMFGLTLVYVGLAEGIAIYGIVISIMILGRI